MSSSRIEQTEQLTHLLAADRELVPDCLDHWAATAPEAVFFYYGETGAAYTYGEFGRMTDAVAGNLAAIGIGKGDKVGVFTTNSLLGALVMFGAWKAGAIYAPINFSLTGRLLAYQMNDTQASVLFTDAGLLPAINAVVDDLDHPPMVVLYPPAPGPDPPPEPIGRLSKLAWESFTTAAARPEVQIAFDDPANIFYTSGTTGPAKGVVQPHRWMAQYTYPLRQPLSTDDVIYNDLPMYHVGGAIMNVVRAAWAGCEVAVWDRFSPADFWSRIAERGATVAILLDVMIPWLMKAPEHSEDRANTLRNVHMQPLPLHHQQVAQRFGIDLVTAGFGQTESGLPLSVFIEEVADGEGTSAEFYRGLSREKIAERIAALGAPRVSGSGVARKGVMGTATPFLEIAVLDERDQPCAVDQPGQLAVRPKLPSVILSEYLGKPEATVAAWRNLWFHTGDAAVLRSDGMYDFIDRLGDRIRVRGENLSSFQVEDLLNQHPKVQMSAAFPIPASDGDEDEVVAFVVTVEGEDVSEQDLHDHARETMPPFMRPKHLRLVPDIPRTPTNKVEKYKLRARILHELAQEDVER